MTDTTATFPSSILSSLNELLRRPADVVGQAAARPPAAAFRLFLGSLVCSALYGAAAGFFGGGQQIAVAALKAPLIVAASLLLCAPSFYVFTSIAGGNFSFREVLTLLAGFAGIIGLLQLGLLPVAWLFSVSSRSILFVVWMHLVLWAVILTFARGFLRSAAGSLRSLRSLLLWTLLFFLVSLQMTTYLRPVLPAEGEPLFAAEKMSFTEHLSGLSAGK